jgi:hypothetical protein
MVSGCGTAPPSVQEPGGVPSIIPGKLSSRQAFEGPLVVEYEGETRYAADGRSCYTFITGTVANQSRQKLSRQTEVHFKVYHANELLFSDLARLRADLPPGNTVQFQMIESPVHLKQCPSYDRIDVFLRKIILP